MHILYSFIITACCALQASEQPKGYKERAAGFYNRFKNALGFRPTTPMPPRPRVAEYEAAFAAQDIQKKEPWNTPWYETRTYEELLPADVKKALDTHQKELAEGDDLEWEQHKYREWLPEYIIKPDYRGEDPGDPIRITGAKKFTGVIKAQRNPMIYIPQKYKYSSTGPEKGHYVISEKVPTSTEPITKAEAAAIAKISYHTKWFDPRTDNFIKMAPERIAIIDTEPFFGSKFERRSRSKEVIYRQMLSDPKRFDPEAIDYLKSKWRKNFSRERFIPVLPSKKSFYSQMGL